MPPIETEEDWKALVEDIVTNAELFASHIEQMDDSALGEAFVDEKYGTYLRNIEGVIEHSCYHLGQVSLLRKMILNQ
jgi:hypothetical protein